MRARPPASSAISRDARLRATSRPIPQCVCRALSRGARTANRNLGTAAACARGLRYTAAHTRVSPQAAPVHADAGPTKGCAHAVGEVPVAPHRCQHTAQPKVAPSCLGSWVHVPFCAGGTGRADAVRAWAGGREAFFGPPRVLDILREADTKVASRATENGEGWHSFAKKHLYCLRGA